MTPEDVARLNRRIEQLFGPNGSINRAVEHASKVVANLDRVAKGADRVGERVNRAAEQCNRYVEEWNRAAAQAERFAAQCSRMNERTVRAAEAGIQQWNGYVRHCDRQLVRVVGSASEQAVRFERATSRLEAGQRVRVNRVLEDWAQRAPSRPPERRPSLLGRIGNWLLGRQRRAIALEEYLGGAHRHPAVARKERGRRWWFEDWRREALIALQLGLDVREFVAIAAVSPVRPRRRNGLRAGSGREDRAHDLLQRLEHVIFPNAPSRAHLTRCPESEMGCGS